MYSGLDPDHDRRSGDPDLGPNCLQRLSTDDKYYFIHAMYVISVRGDENAKYIKGPSGIILKSVQPREIYKKLNQKIKVGAAYFIQIIILLASMREFLILLHFEQHTCIPACTSTQSDQYPCCLFSGWYIS